MARREPINNVTRVGIPRNLLADLYVVLIERSWVHLAGLLITAFLGVNALFAGLYLLGGDVIANAEPGRLTDAFFFSVQSFSTIGFGGLAPKTAYADWLVTAESLAGIVFGAVATGLAFAKFARPRANVIFSNTAVVSVFDGVPTFMFRVGNARGIELVEATLSVTLLRSYQSTEGHTLRQLHDVALVRHRTPFFSMSWQVMHRIDASSPMYGLDAQAMCADEMFLLVTLTGHDVTYGQTVHDRHLYRAQDVRWGHRFVDVIERLPDGALRLDFGRFHDTVPDEEARP